MSVYMTFDAGPGEQVASNKGWSDFCRWGRSLKDAPAIEQLLDHGYSADIAGILSDLGAASIADVLGLADTVAGIKRLLSANESAEAVFVTDGMGPE